MNFEFLHRILHFGSVPKSPFQGLVNEWFEAQHVKLLAPRTAFRACVLVPNVIGGVLVGLFANILDANAADVDGFLEKSNFFS